MNCNNKEIKYKFELSNKLRIEFNINKNISDHNAFPDWAKLEFKKCPKCILKENEYKFCPALKENIELLEYFSDSNSYDEVKVTAENIVKKIRLEDALSSIFSISMLVSECPVLGELKNIACTFSPFLTFDDLASKIFTDNNEKDKNIFEVIDDIRETFKYLCRRFSGFSNGDANRNAITRLDSYFMRLKMFIENKDNK